MPKQRQTLDLEVPKREVSPLGASKFERPYKSTPAGRTSTNTSRSIDAPVHVTEPSPPTPRTSTNTSPSIPHDGHHFSKPSLVSTVPTTYSSSANSSANRFEQALDEISNASCPRPEDRDAWFQKQTEEELDLPVGQGDECPDGATLAAVQDIPIYDAEGNARPFGSLYDPESNTNHRQLIIFIRHFYCGGCQAFVKALTDGINMEDYFRIPNPTSIVLIGCGKPDIIHHYKKFTNGSHFPVFAEPTRKLFKTLGMKWSTSFGDRPEYMKDISALDMVKGQVRDVKNSVKDPDGIRKRDVFRGGALFQIGGEFLFEDGMVIWCHRMRHMRGHAEVAVLRKLLELDPEST